MEHHGSATDKPAGIKLCIGVVHIDDVAQLYKIECEAFITWLDGHPNPRAKDEIKEYDEKEFFGEGDVEDKSVGHHSHVPKPEFYHCEHMEHVDDNVFARNARTGRCFVQYNMLVTLRERLELHRFPFDRQLFKISLWPDNAKFVQWKNAPLNLKAGETIEGLDWAEIHDAADWDIKTVLEVNQWVLEKEWASPDSWSTVADDGEKLVVQVACSRDPSFVLSNIVLVNFFVVPTAMTNVGLDPAEDLADRVNLTLTCILTVVAFKFVMTSMIPSVSYLTLLDRYMLFTFAILGMSVVESYVVSVMSNNSNDFGDTDSATKLDTYFHGILFGFWIILHLFIVVGHRAGWFVLSWDDVVKADQADTFEEKTEVLKTKREQAACKAKKSRKRAIRAATSSAHVSLTEGGSAKTASVELSASTVAMVQNPMPRAPAKTAS